MNLLLCLNLCLCCVLACSEQTEQDATDDNQPNIDETVVNKVEQQNVSASNSQKSDEIQDHSDDFESDFAETRNPVGNRNPFGSSNYGAGRCPLPVFPGSNSGMLAHMAPSCKMVRCSQCENRPPDFFLDLRTKKGSYVQQFNDGRAIFTSKRWTKSKPHAQGCDFNTAIRVRFPKATKKQVQKTRLKVDFFWSAPTFGFIFHIADTFARDRSADYSPSGAEVFAKDGHVFVYANHEEGFQYHSLNDNGLMYKGDFEGCSKLSFVIGDEMLQYNDNRDTAVCLQSPFLFLLRQQCRTFEKDTDQDIYIGLNKFVTSNNSNARFGNGLCAVSLTWIEATNKPKSQPEQEEEPFVI